jgi:hypothetical protein
MEPAHYTDPLEEALSHGSQRVAQLASLAAAMAQVVMQRRALEEARKTIVGDERAGRMLDEQERLLRQQARLSWAPAHDAQWLAQAGFVETARAWAGAAAYADTDPAPASALRKCEDKLRTLHPYAMARYDRLRGEGMSPLDAMREAAPLFARVPDVRVGDPADPRQALSQEAWPGGDLPTEETPAYVPEPGPAVPLDDRGEQRGREIVEQLQQRARVVGRPRLEADELTMVLEAATNLPVDVIDRVTRDAPPMAGSDSEERRAAMAERPQAADLGHTVDPPASPLADERTTGLVDAHLDAGTPGAAQAQAARGQSAAQIAARSFPYSASEAVRAAATARVKAHGPAAVPVEAPALPKRPAPPL